MIDTVTLWLPDASLNSLAVEREMHSENGIVRYASLGNLRLKETAKGVSLTGSLPKFHLGDNVHRFTRLDVEQSLERLCDETSLDWRQAKVFRLDISATLPVKQPCSSYLTELGDLARFQRLEMPNGLVYKTNAKAFLVYDKVKEQRRLGEAIPKAFQGFNLLRLELQFRNRLPEAFKTSEILAERLYNQSFYVKALTMWKDVYFAIQKRKRLKITRPEMLNVKRLESSLAALALAQIGVEPVMQAIKEAKLNGKISKLQAQRLRAKVKSISTLPEMFEESDCIVELDGKVKQIVQSYR
jgi:hypothetical protein